VLVSGAFFNVALATAVLPLMLRWRAPLITSLLSVYVPQIGG
jgi:hypothetical protein